MACLSSSSPPNPLALSATDESSPPRRGKTKGKGLIFNGQFSIFKQTPANAGVFLGSSGGGEKGVLID
jgi:hypothetical protein